MCNRLVLGSLDDEHHCALRPAKRRRRLAQLEIVLRQHHSKLDAERRQGLRCLQVRCILRDKAPLAAISRAQKWARAYHRGVARLPSVGLPRELAEEAVGVVVAADAQLLQTRGFFSSEAA